ncbi:MAG TPA: hypothetical protein VM096_19240 [Vicinamibacterales bacterium]|nr:hypothetical protein [Vicinamibacterales bacterium]
MPRWLPVIASVWMIASASAQDQLRLWVLQAPDRLVEYDVATFQQRGSISVPAYVVTHSEHVKVGPRGQLLFQLPRDFQFGDAPELSGRLWFWDGAQARTWPSRDRQAFLSTDGQFLIWFANTFAKDVDPDGNEKSVRTSARVWRTDLSGRNEVTLVSIPPAPACSCATGTCSESCPEWTMWARHGVVDDVFVLTQVTPGQLEPSHERSVLYRREGAQWRPAVLPSPLEEIVESDASADMLVATVLDAGCCGWINESSNQTALTQGGRRTILFDEFTRFGNSNYDISFYTVAAALTPGRLMIGHTIHGDVLEEEIRLSSDGKANAVALTKIRAAIAALPVTEIIELGAAPKVITTIPHVDLVGWLNDREFLGVEDGMLVVYDAHGAKLRTTAVRANRAAAFLR